MTLRMLGALGIAAALALPSLAAKAGEAPASTETVSTQMQWRGDSGKGSAFRERANRLAELAARREFDAAASEAAALRRDFEAIFDPALKQRCFLQRADMEAWQQRSHEEGFEWIDWGYFQAVQIQMYLAAERRDFPAALSYVRQLSVLAPVSALTLNEMAYVQGQMHQPREALANYRKAIDMARQYESQRPVLPAAMRGAGFALIELNRLEEARQVFEESLRIDPGNKVALNELAYIDGLLRR